MGSAVDRSAGDRRGNLVVMSQRGKDPCLVRMDGHDGFGRVDLAWFGAESRGPRQDRGEADERTACGWSLWKGPDAAREQHFCRPEATGCVHYSTPCELWARQ